MDLLNAIRTGSIADVEKGLSKPGRSVNEPIMGGRSPLHHAIACKSRPIVEWLVEHKMADVNLADDEDSTPLMIAISKNYALMVKYLIENGADPGGKDQDNRPYHEITDNELILKYLRECKQYT